MNRARMTAFGVAAVWAMLIFIGDGTARVAEPEDSVVSFHESLLGTMKEGRTLGASGRYARIEPVIHRLFDIPSMARLAIGSTWPGLSPAQQQLAVAAFGAYISAIYADRFDSYSGQRLEVIGHQPSAANVLVKTQIVTAGGEPVAVNYLMNESDGGWRIADVYLDGAISQLAAQRSEFGAILRRDGFDGLIATLQRKVNLLTGTLARAR
jgi:phospholipid transport system substrate-binding protein